MRRRVYSCFVVASLLILFPFQPSLGQTVLPRPTPRGPATTRPAPVRRTPSRPVATQPAPVKSTNRVKLEDRVIDPVPDVIIQDQKIALYDAIFSPDGKWLATASGDKAIRLYSVPDWKLKYTLEATCTGNMCLAFSPDSHRLASGSLDGTAKIWDVDAGAMVGNIISGDQHVHTLAFSPDGKSLVTGSCDCRIRTWDVDSEKPLHTFQVPGQVFTIAWMPDGKNLLYGLQTLTEGYPGPMPVAPRIIDAVTGKENAVFCSGTNQQVGLFGSLPSADAKHALFASAGGGVEYWDLENKRCLWSHQNMDNWLPHLRVTADFSKYTVSQRWYAYVRAVDDDRELFRASIGGSTRAVAISPDGRWLAVCGYGNTSTGTPDFTLLPVAQDEPGGDSRMFVWDLAKAKAREIPSLMTLERSPVLLRFDAQAKTLLLGARDNLELWDLNTCKRLWQKPVDFGFSLTAISEDGKLIANSASCSDAYVQLWSMVSGKKLFSARVKEYVRVIAMSADCKHIAVGCDEAAYVFSTETGAQELRYQLPAKKSVESIGISEDGKAVTFLEVAFHGTQDNRLVHLDVATGNVVSALTPEQMYPSLKHTPWAGISRNAKWAILHTGSKEAGDQTLILWNVAKAEPEKKIHSDWKGLVDVDVTNDGRRAVSRKYEVLLLDLESPTPARALPYQSPGVRGRLLSTDGSALLTVSEDNTVRIVNWNDTASTKP